MAREASSSASFWCLAALALPLGTLAQDLRQGSEFQVNTYTTDEQSRPSVAADADGDFVVTWRSASQDGANHGVFAQLFSSAGAPVASEFQVNTHTASYQGGQSVAMEANGDFVVAWADAYGYDGSGYGVFAQRFSSAGAPLASEFQVNSQTANHQRSPAVAVDSDGDFVVAWNSNGQDGGTTFELGVFARRFSSAGAPLATEFQVNTYTTSQQRNPSVAVDAGGNFVVAWNSLPQDGDNYGIFARSFSSAGTPLATEFQVNTHTPSIQYAPSVATDNDGDFVVVWQSYLQDDSGSGVFAHRFSSASTPLAAEFQVNTHTTSQQMDPSVAASASGDLVVTWSSYGQDGSHKGVFARRFSSAGAPLASEFQVNTYTLNPQGFPAVAAAASGDFVVAYELLSDGDHFGIFAQRFSLLATLDLDGDGEVESLTDGLLVLRAFFGFTGATLTSGAVDLGDCTRCDAAAIQPYIEGLGLILDLDDDGATGPLTDGLLALRFLFGFTGATLTTGAVNLGGCDRCDAPSIEAYLAGLTG